MNNDNAPSAAQPRPPLGVLIQSAIQAAGQLKGQPGIDKKWLNKTVARLEEAELYADKAEQATYQIQPLSASNPVKPAGCTCPMVGVLDTQCPVHGGNR